MSTKKPIGIISDETLDLPEEMIQKYNITVVNYKVDYQNMADVEGNVYQKMRYAEERGLPSLIKTSQPSINDYLKAYKEKLEEYEEVICFTISSKVSGSYNSALQAIKFMQKDLQQKITVFDSEGGTGELGLLVLRTIKLIEEAKLKLSEINERMLKEVKNIKLIAFYEKAKWLETSGRVPRFIPMQGMEKITGIKPLLGLRDGKLTIIGIKRNVKELAQSLSEEFDIRTEKIRQAGKKIVIAITHADNEKTANRIREKIEQMPNTEIAFISQLCVAIGGHAGPGAITISWDEN
ncbi:MAG: DegV family protein [Minisyncoccus archaeiphilus]|jgi:DegV family protein with EDD domain|uniref:DegV family protein n=1 Tax=Minisyncoccus archaeiphilus TaxID=3238481 RepID=UPI002B0A2A71|nr:MAG: DegV family protein [Candidatus Parcubacteria bacterium]